MNKIVLDENRKVAQLINGAGRLISEYTYKNLCKNDFTEEDFKKNIASFNAKIEKVPDFTNIRDMAEYVKSHNFDEVITNPEITNQETL